LSNILNASWLFCWHYNRFGLSVLVMLALLGTLIASYLALGIGKTASSSAERWCIDIPFSVYLGWVSVATIANITDYLYFIKWNGFGIDPQLWAVIMLAIASVLGLLMATRERNAAFLLVFVWSFVGIANKQAAAPLVATSAWAAALVVLVLAGYSLLGKKRIAA
jgi:hypothetical protein